ncbi:hypothetical protein KGY79_10335, partial [Candidatus Bipolaricaulota bacterium]|nr:hypothetical protein [Candidatus Bipolaricaulota bacterium]
MKKLIVIFVVAIVLFSATISVFGSQEPGWATVPDTTGDSRGPNYTDIIRVSIAQIDSNQAVALMWLAGSIPRHPSSYIGYVWPLDIDSRGDTGQPNENDIGSEFNLRVAYRPEKGWGAFIDDTRRKEAKKVRDFNVDHAEGVVSIVFPIYRISEAGDMRFGGHIAFQQSRPDFSGAEYID